MSETIINTRIQNKRDTEENWKSNDPILLDGELAIVDIDNEIKIKVGDGHNSFNDLGYVCQTLESAYPAGSIYMSMNPTNPSKLFGFGVWDQIEDTFLLAAGYAYPAGSTGGEETVTLSKAQTPNVYGQFTMHHAAISTNVSAVDGCFTTDTRNSNAYKDGGNAMNGAASIGRVIFDNGGQGEAHNNMPPYLAVYMFYRVK